jgi:hypothetical protein
VSEAWREILQCSEKAVPAASEVDRAQRWPRARITRHIDDAAAGWRKRCNSDALDDLAWPATLVDRQDQQRRVPVYRLVQQPRRIAELVGLEAAAVAGDLLRWPAGGSNAPNVACAVAPMT